jgi:hypothetical protein
MSKHKELQFLPQVILYLINVYEPSGEKRLLDMLTNELAPEGLRGNVSVRLLRKVVKNLIEAELVIKADDNTYCVSERGLERLAKIRVAFPRDKFRLYFIKDALKMRDR